MGRLIDFSDIDKEWMDSNRDHQQIDEHDMAEITSLIGQLDALYDIIDSEDFPKNLYNEATRNRFRDVTNFLTAFHGQIPHIDYSL